MFKTLPFCALGSSLCILPLGSSRSLNLEEVAVLWFVTQILEKPLACEALVILYIPDDRVLIIVGRKN